MDNPHYWCTWRTQNTLSRKAQPEGASPLLFAGDQGAKLARTMLNEATLFGEGGMAYQFEGFRDKLFFLLDDGWDVSYETHPDQNRHLFSSLILDLQRFPSYFGEPWQRLAKLNERLKEIGWRGLGLWVACQNFEEHSEGPFVSEQEARDFWSERFNWCEHAGVAYVKVDWGARCEDAAYRKIMTEEAHRCAPHLMLEHARPCSPMNDVFHSNQFFDWQPMKDAFAEIANYSDIFRIYDTAPQLSIPTTIGRCAALLQTLPAHSKTLLNCEDEPYIAVGLGLCIGAMRSPLRAAQESRKDPFYTSRKILELQRALEWFSLTPAFSKSTYETGFFISEKILSDTWFYKKDDFWWNDLTGKNVEQTAPAVCARNMSLPSVSTDSSTVPYILCCKYPNGLTAISFLPRLLSKSAVDTSMCNVSITAGDTVGIFGKFETLTVVIPIQKGMHIFMRDLADSHETDITRESKLSENSYTVSWQVLKAHSICTPNDESEIGCILSVR